MNKIIRFGGSTIEIRGSGEPAIKLLDYLFMSSYSVATPDIKKINSTLRVEYREDTGCYHCFRNDEPLYIGLTESIAARCMLESAIYSLAYDSDTGLMFHSAALEYNNQIVLIPGVSGAGKTTLSAWLTSKGFRYLTDEMVFVLDGSKTVQAFMRPFNVKTRGISAIESFVKLASLEENIIRDGLTTLIPHWLVNPEPANPQAKLGLIVYPGYAENADFSFKQITTADSSSRMMGMLINARNLEGHGFHQTSALVNSVPSFELKYSRFENVFESITEQINQGSAHARNVDQSALCNS